MLTGNLFRAARVLAGLGRDEVSTMAGLTHDAVSELENAGSSAVRADGAPARQLRAALEKAGIEFLDNGGPGVRLRANGQRDEGILTQDLNAENDG